MGTRSAHFHPKAWGLWLLAALAAAVLTQNPFYLLVVILAAGVNYRSLGRESLTAQHWGTFLRIGLALVLFSLFFNLLTANAGDTPLFTLPALRWTITSPDQQSAVVQIGGTVTLEGLVYSLTNALGLMAVLTVFATFNTLVDHYQLLRSTPRFLYQSAIVASIAVTFVPQMVVAQREIREAQALRGHRFQGIRDLPPLFIALLTEGLERSITLAESMDARGFGGQPSEHPGRQELLLSAPFIRGASTHGTGCTYSAAIAGHLARGCSLPQAVQRAKDYITQAIARSQTARGHGVLNCFWS